MKSVPFYLLACFICLCFVTCQHSKPTDATDATTANSKKTVDKFSDHVRNTEFQTPEKEKAGFKLPAGFEITLYASEPDISKPINMEFDAKGRLWVSQSSEYPMAANPDKGHDKITILEDTDKDGKADKFTHFADDLNIPIGIMPAKDGAVAFSIPNVYHLIDKDGDGKYDDKKVLYGPFGYKDTHGMVSNLIRGFDGWIHSCHGFTNTSTIAGTDGDSITMISGNTFRFKEDGSRVEQTTYGRVNPFGYSFDEWGYLYSVDCHSKPIYQLINGAEYPHFGKKSPAIGFAPEMMSYELGSTALSGLVYYIGNLFPKEYQNNFYNGDVVTCRINRNTVNWKGSSPVSQRQEDFLISEDPWFRPVDIKLGPDGAMYVADFYNRIIGHYEVPLNHPGRDRQSGRIWKITYTGNKEKNTENNKDWSIATAKELIAGLAHPQLTMRIMIADQFVQRIGKKGVEPLLSAMKSPKADKKTVIHGMWILHRLNSLPDLLFEKALTDKDPMVQVHALRVLTEKKSLSPQQRSIAWDAFKNSNPHVQRMAAQVMEKFPETNNVRGMLSLYQSVSDSDSHLKYTVLISLRQNLRNEKVIKDVAATKWNESELALLAKILPDVPSQRAASFALNYLKTHALPEAQLITSLEHIGRYVAPESLNDAISIIRKQFADDINTQYQLYQTISKGIAQKGGKSGAMMQDWAVTMAEKFLKTVEGKDNGWWHTNIERDWVVITPWNRVSKQVIKDKPNIDILWSEYDWDPTGKLQSPSFVLPEQLSLDVYDSEVWRREDKLGTSKNVLRIRLDKSKQIAAEYRFSTKKPMIENDLINAIKLDLGKFKGQKGYIELLDSSRAGGIGIANITPAVVSLPSLGAAQISTALIKAAGIIGDYNVAHLEPQLLIILHNRKTDIEPRAAAAKALMKMAPKKHAGAVIDIFNSLGEASELKQKLVAALEIFNTPAVLSTLRKGLIAAPQRLQLDIAGTLVQSQAGTAQLIDAAKAGDIEISLLDEVSIKEQLMAKSSVQQRKQLDLLMKTVDGKAIRRQLIEERLKSFDTTNVTVSSGRQVFTQNCSMCHQIKGNGGMIGPQLDGIGNWGQKALTEKILNPNGNISEAFRSYNVTLKDGKTMSGLFRREEGEVLIFANASGQEFSISKGDIKERIASKFTLMPDQFGKTISKTDFDALLKFLLNTKE